ncbi:MAG TPA: hypothetical protein VN843_17530 [Anaerolineales bacterium]|nr:hypothetical protein [Anaerolineales bacterium]
MLNPISNAVKDIHMTIPREILIEVFGRVDPRDWRQMAPLSIDEMIKSKVIRHRVLNDCNLIGGRQALISLVGLEAHCQDTYTTIYNIPLERTGNREILSVLSINYLPQSVAMGTIGNPYGSMNSLSIYDTQVVAQRIMDSVSNAPHVSSATCELIGYNTVMVTDNMRATQNYELRCMLANDENLSNLSPRSYPAFSKACFLATKSYIYNTLTIRIDQGVLEQGQSLGKYREIVDEYRESEEQYQEFLKTVLRKVLFMNDVTSHERYISSMINPGI